MIQVAIILPALSKSTDLSLRSKPALPNISTPPLFVPYRKEEYPIPPLGELSTALFPPSQKQPSFSSLTDSQLDAALYPLSFPLFPSLPSISQFPEGIMVVCRQLGRVD